MPAEASHSNFDLITSDGPHWKINGTRLGDEVEDLYELFEDFAPGPIRCQYCAQSLDVAQFEDVANGNDKWHFDRTYGVSSCRNCGFWDLRAVEAGNKCMDSRNMVAAGSVAAKFDLQAPEPCPSEFAHYLRCHPHFWNEMDPRQLEKLVACIWKANYSNCEVTHVGRPGDLGVDVLFVESEGRRWLIQVKRRETAKKAEGFSTLQNILGTLVLQGEQRGIIVSTADYFSTQLIKQRKNAESKGYFVELVDRGKLHRMLSPLLPDRPWLTLLKSDRLEAADAEVRQYLAERVPSAAERLLF